MDETYILVFPAVQDVKLSLYIERQPNNRQDDQTPMQE